MKRLCAVTLIILAAVSVAFGQTKADEEELIRIDKEIGIASMKGDAATLSRYYADDYRTNNPNNLLNKQQVVEQAVKNAAGVTNPSYTSENYSIRFLDPNTAVMTHTGTARGTENGKEFNEPHQAMHVWVKRNGQWQLFASAGAPLPDQAVLMQMERDWADAVKRRDAAWLERHYADEYTWTSPDGTILDRKGDIEDVKNTAFDSMEMSDTKVTVNGDTAVVTGVTTIKGKHKGQDISGKYRFTDTFVKRNGRWMILASQATRVAAPAATASN